MANYYGTGRTNYFRVKDAKKFRKEMSRFAVEVIEQDGMFCLLDKNMDGGGFTWWDEAREFDADPVELLAPHLADGEVLVMIETGHEKYRYLVGYAMAFNNTGDMEYLNLGDIYKQAARLGPNMTHAQH